MFRINILGNVLRRIAGIRKPYEGIGILIGGSSNDELWITDSIIGGEESTDDELVIPVEKLERIADDIIKGKIEGKIVGWYLSRPGYGISMSKTDLKTHKRLLQFSPFVVTLVADPEIGEFGIWALEPDVGIVQVPSENIKIGP